MRLSARDIREAAERLTYVLNRFGGERFVPASSGLWADWPARLPPLDALWVVTTFNRPAACAGMIRALAAVAERRSERLRLVVVDDGSTLDYTDARAALADRFGERGLYLRATRNLGKREFWKTYQLLFDLAQAHRPGYAMVLQDDVRFLPDFLDRALGLLGAIADPRKAVLSMISMRDDDPGGRWVRFPRRRLGTVWQTQWFDLPGFIALPRMFSTLSYHVFPVSPRRWASHPTVSSGVARQLSLRLFRRASTYQVCESLLVHDPGPSLMNPEAAATRW